MFFRIRPVLGLLAVAAIVAAGCGGSKGTPTAPPISDPNEIVTRSVVNVLNAKTFHVKAEISGKIGLAALGMNTGLGGNIDLAGTTVEGDVDVANCAYDLKLNLPGLFGLTGEVIGVDGSQYTRISLQGDKFSESESSCPIPTAEPGASPSSVESMVAEFRQSLEDQGATATLKGDEKVAGQDAYHVSISIPLDKLNSLISEGAGSVAAGMTLDSATLDYWVYKASVLPGKLHVAGSVSSAGNLDIVATLTDYDARVTIKAPEASQVQ
jgi:hypothetical protein